MLKSRFSLIRPRRGEEGFTLLELLIVVIVIGILAAIALPVFLTQQAAAYDASAQSDVRNTVAQVVGWQALNRGTPELTAAGYLDDGGKLVTSPHSYVGLSVAADGSYTVCGYNVRGNKYKDAAHNWEFTSTTGRSTTGTAECAAAVNGDGKSATEVEGAASIGSTTKVDQLHAAFIVGNDSTNSGDDGLNLSGTDYMSKGSTVNAPSVPTLNGKAYPDAATAPGSASGAAASPAIQKADGTALVMKTPLSGCKYQFGYGRGDFSGTGDGTVSNVVVTKVTCDHGAITPGTDTTGYTNFVFTDTDGKVDTLQVSNDPNNPPASNYPSPQPYDPSNPDGNATPTPTTTPTPTPTPTDTTDHGNDSPTTVDPANDPTPQDPAGNPDADYVSTRVNMRNYPEDNPSSSEPARPGFNNSQSVLSGMTYVSTANSLVMPSVPLIDGKVFTASSRTITDTITNVNFYTAPNGVQLTTVDGKPWSDCDANFVLTKGDHNNVIDTTLSCENGVHALTYEGKDIHLSDYHWLKFTDSLGRVNWVKAEIGEVSWE